MPLPPAPCGKADTCEHCPYPDCRYDGLSAMEYKASYSADADARHSNMDKRANQRRAYREANREKYNAYHREYYGRKKEQRNERKKRSRTPRLGGDTVRGIVIDPGKAPQIVRMPDDGQALERWLGGDALLRVHPAKPAALLYTMRKSNLIRDCDLPGVPGYTRIWRGSRYYGRLLLIGWRRGKPASLPKDLAEELAREWAAEEVSS